MNNNYFWLFQRKPKIEELIIPDWTDSRNGIINGGLTIDVANLGHVFNVFTSLFNSLNDGGMGFLVWSSGVWLGKLGLRWTWFVSVQCTLNSM